MIKKLIATASLALLLCGCVSYASYNVDKSSIESKLRWQMVEIRELQEDVIEMRRGYRIIPVTVTITNDCGGVWRNN